MKTRDDIREDILYRLGDVAGRLWDGNEIDQYIQEGYNNLSIATGCLWEQDCLPDYDYAFTHTAAFEEQLLMAIPESVINRCCQFTSLFERDFLDNAEGPANHNYHWEHLDGLTDELSGSTVAALETLPVQVYRIERATWNTRRIDPMMSREFEGMDSRYELNTGEVLAYVRDKDGLRTLRKWRVPSVPYIPYTFDDDSNDFGILRFLDEIDND